VVSICNKLVKCGMGRLHIVIGENLSYKNERIVEGFANELREQKFDSMSVMLVQNPQICEEILNDKDAGDNMQSGTGMKQAIPRLMIAGGSSDCGKTTITCALLTELVRRGLKTTSFKCGPDYIDPIFHSKVIGTKSRNLDLYLADKKTVRRLLAQNVIGCDIAVIEGVMGYYDGIAGKSIQASSYHLAQATDTPVVLVADCKGMSVSVASFIKGFLEFRKPSKIHGVILNRVSSGIYPELKQLIETETGIRVYGYLPIVDQGILHSRHLGLVATGKMRNLRQKLHALAREFNKTVDIDALIELADQASLIEYHAQKIPKLDQMVKVAIAQDKAFYFYYQDSLDILEQMGIMLTPFSPLNDTVLPDDIAGIIIGGGYPELYAKQLSGNAGILAEIRNKIENGMPCIAECGGFMYLHESMQDDNGTPYPMVGIIKGQCVKTNKLARFGYAEITAKKDGLLHKDGQATRVHEFHYWDSDTPGNDYTAQKPLQNRVWNCVYVTDTMYAGFPHLYFAKDHEAAWRFVQACAAYAEKKR
jgi:cobyrinic acid a,c-diamide synthase